MKPITSLLTLLFAAVALTPAATAQTGTMNAYTFAEDSKMWVSGTSTLHDWECPVNDMTGDLRASEGESTFTAIGSTTITVPVESIVCEKDKMNDKLQDALEMKKHPEVSFTAETVELTTADDGSLTAAATGTLSMAGETRDVTVDGTVSTMEDGRFKVTGVTPVLLSDFNIDPPKALLGTVKTGDEVKVHFEVVLQPVQAN